MTTFTFRGMMAPTFAPFKDDGSLNLEMIPAYAKYLKKMGITGAWVNGSVGEGMSMTIAERKAMGEAWMKCTKDIPTIILHCGAGCLKDTQELASHAETLGVSAVAVLPCLYDPPTSPTELVDYLLEVAKACPKTPLFYYHIPVKTHVNLSMSEVLREGVKRIPTLSGIKFTDEDVSGEGKKCLMVDASLTIFTGYDQRLQEAISVGFTCAINGGFSIFADRMSRIFQLMEEGEVEEAKKMQKEIIHLHDVIAKQTGGSSTVGGIKAAMAVITGMEMGPARFPLKNFTPEMKAVLKTDLKNAGLKVY